MPTSLTAFLRSNGLANRPLCQHWVLLQMERDLPILLILTKQVKRKSRCTYLSPCSLSAVLREGSDVISLELTVGLEPTANRLQIYCAANCATSALVERGYLSAPLPVTALRNQTRIRTGYLAGNKVIETLCIG